MEGKEECEEAKVVVEVAMVGRTVVVATGGRMVVVARVV